MTLSIHDLAQTRVTTKHYSGEALDRETVRAILDAARLAPTSVNAQCTKIFVASTPEAREKIAPAFADFNQERVLKASDVVVFAVYDGVIPDAHFKRVLEKEIEDGRYAQAEIGPQMDAGRRGFAALQSKTPERCTAWQARQAYIALGFALLAAQSLGADATYLEGADFKKLDEILGLSSQGLTSVVALSLGRSSPDDGNHRRPKSRLGFEEVVTAIR